MIWLIMIPFFVRELKNRKAPSVLFETIRRTDERYSCITYGRLRNIYTILWLDTIVEKLDPDKMSKQGNSNHTEKIQSKTENFF